MTTMRVMTPVERKCLQAAARDLHARFRGTFSEESIHFLLLDSYQELAAGATVTRWLAVRAEQFARQRLEAIVHTRDLASRTIPAVLLLCVHNTGRSQMALGWFTHLAGGRVVAWSAGIDPAGQVNPTAVAAMAEVGIDISAEFPKPWAGEFWQAADMVVTMGCGDTCPLVPGKQYEDWELEDPDGKTLEQVRIIRDQIRDRVAGLLSSLGVPA